MKMPSTRYVREFHRAYPNSSDTEHLRRAIVGLFPLFHRLLRFNVIFPRLNPSMILYYRVGNSTCHNTGQPPFDLEKLHRGSIDHRCL